jgi:hypothetical protein
MAEFGPVFHVGTIKVITWASHLYFNNVTSTNSSGGYYVGNTASASTVTEGSAGTAMWANHFRIFFRAASDSASNGNPGYGSYPYCMDSQSTGSSWDRSGIHFSETQQSNNNGSSSWWQSQSQSQPGAQWMCSYYGDGTNRYSFVDTPTPNASLAEGSQFFDTGFIDWVYNGNTYTPTITIKSSGNMPYGSTIGVSSGVNYMMNNFLTGGVSTGGPATGTPYQFQLYNGAGWAAGSTFSCYRWGSRNIEPN